MTPRKILLIAALGAGLAACDRGARKDLPQDSQDLDEGMATIMLMPDQFPNVAHKCFPNLMTEEQGDYTTTGVWNLTRDDTWIVFNDPECGGTGAIVVLDNVPGGNASSEDGQS